MNPNIPSLLPDLSFGWLMAKTFLALGIVVALAYLFIRYVIPKLQLNKRGTGGFIQIIDRLGLEPRKSLFIVRIGSKQILIGASEQGLTKIADLDPSDIS